MRKLTIFAALLVAVSAQAQSLDDVVSNVMKEYGGKAAWEKVTSLRETGTVVPVMRKGDGKLTRTWSAPYKLTVEIAYPTETEVRVVDGDHGTRNGKEVTGGSLDAMKLQAARLELPLLLVTKRAALKDLGTKDGIRAIEIPLSETLTLTLNLDLKTSLGTRIRRRLQRLPAHRWIALPIRGSRHSDGDADGEYEIRCDRDQCPRNAASARGEMTVTHCAYIAADG